MNHKLIRCCGSIYRQAANSCNRLKTRAETPCLPATFARVARSAAARRASGFAPLAFGSWRLGTNPCLPVVLLLLGGDKSTQTVDVARAQESWQAYEEGKRRGKTK
jgi:hypothetical protein